MSFGELLIVLLVAVVAIGPKELPKIAHGVGKFIAKWRQVSTNLQAEIDEELKQVQLTENITKAEAADDLYYQRDRHSRT